MRKIAASLVAFVFAGTLGLGLLSAPTTALSHPGYTCNPAPGHGASGCHRVTASSVASTRRRSIASVPTMSRVTASRMRATSMAQTAALVRAAAKAQAALKARIQAAEKRAEAIRAARAAKAAEQPMGAAVDGPDPAPAALPASADDPTAEAPQPWWVALWHLIIGD